MPEAKRDQRSSQAKRDAYLKHPGASLPLIVAIIALFVSGIACWMVFGCETLFTTGSFYGANKVAFCYIPTNEVDTVEVGDTIWIDNAKGTLNTIDTDKAYTVDQIEQMVQSMAKLNMDSDKSYYLMYVQFSEPVSTQGTYRIFRGTATPLQMLTGAVSDAE